MHAKSDKMYSTFCTKVMWRNYCTEIQLFHRWGGGKGWLKVAVATPEISLATLVAIQQMMMFLLLLLFSVYFEKQNMQ